MWNVEICECPHKFQSIRRLQIMCGSATREGFFLHYFFWYFIVDHTLDIAGASQLPPRGPPDKTTLRNRYCWMYMLLIKWFCDRLDVVHVCSLNYIGSTGMSVKKKDMAKPPHKASYFSNYCNHFLPLQLCKSFFQRNNAIKYDNYSLDLNSKLSTSKVHAISTKKKWGLKIHCYWNSRK